MRFHLENLAKHGVTTDEAEEALTDGNAITHKTKGGAFLVIGKTFSGRFLEIAYRKLPEKAVFIFHAMDAREHQKKRYKQR
ncbi:MAG: hypothetical protein JST01_23630 [Cyanobacteria bacterium SZAS TMP-1]|nr:hypothetical protein [Cyanobacteria bacterium SZAS TMP-1]